MMRTAFPAFAIALLLCIASASAAPPPEEPSPHEASAPGRIIGRLTGEGQAPLPQHTVALEILRGRTLILAIPKQTDANGRYEFKNIFRSPEFSYAVSAQHEGKTYRTPFVSLSTREEQRTLDLATGEGTSEAPPLPPPTQPGQVQAQRGGSPEAGPHGGDGLGQYKLLALILSLVAAGLALAGRRR